MPLSPVEGYDIAAMHYDNWHWQEFWHRNEWPIIKKELSLHPEIHSILDVGCGTGWTMGQLIDCGYECHGLDSSSRMLEFAKRRLGNDFDLLNASVYSIPYRDGQFDCALACRIFSHLSDLQTAFKEFSRVVRMSGYLLVTDLHSEHCYRKGHTRISGDWGEILIDTYTHSPESIIEIANVFGWVPVSRIILNAQNISWMPLKHRRFSSLDPSSDRPISYILLFQKAENKILSKIESSE